jgi:hypothetical protein
VGHAWHLNHTVQVPQTRPRGLEWGGDQEIPFQNMKSLSPSVIKWLCDSCCPRASPQFSFLFILQNLKWPSSHTVPGRQGAACVSSASYACNLESSPITAVPSFPSSQTLPWKGLCLTLCLPGPTPSATKVPAFLVALSASSRAPP